VTFAAADDTAGLEVSHAPAAVKMTAGGTVTGRAPSRAEREWDRYVQEQTFTTIVASAEVAQAARVGTFRNAGNPTAMAAKLITTRLAPPTR
jgi:hypothetical protein